MFTEILKKKSGNNNIMLSSIPMTPPFYLSKSCISMSTIFKANEADLLIFMGIKENYIPVYL